MLFVENLKGVININLSKQWKINWQIFRTQAFIPQLHNQFLKHKPVATWSKVQTISAFSDHEKSSPGIIT